MWALIEYWKISVWVIGIPLLFGVLGHLSTHSVIRYSENSKNKIDNSIAKHLFKPFLWIIVAFIIRIGLGMAIPTDDTEGKLPEDIRQLFAIIIIMLIAWAFIKALSVFEDYLAYNFDINVKDNLRARKKHTQFRVLRRIIIILIVIIAVASILMTFEKIKALGTTILASAGVIGIVVGFAAQKTIGTFIAGLQIAFTQPIRVDDVVIVEGEWGRIEEITLTYVVVKIWDLRRLIVPITYFIEKPFQNWTRTEADILGTVFIYVDHTVPTDSVREELQRILEQSQLWDKKVCVLQVTNTSERTVELRALMSAPDASIAWSLRCEVREKLLQYLQKKYPKSLPKLRVEMEPQTKPRSRQTKTRK